MAEAARAVEAAGRRPGRHQHGLPGAQDLQDRRRRRAAGRPATRPRGIVAAMVRAVDIPVTVKMRRGLTPPGLDARPRPPVASRQPAPPRSASTRAPRPRSTRAAPTTASPPRSWPRSDVPVIASGDIVTPGRRPPGAGRHRVRGRRRRPRRPWAIPGSSATSSPAVARPRPDMAEVVDEIAALRRRRAARPRRVAGLRLPAEVLPAGIWPGTTCRPASWRRCSPPRPWTAPSRACASLAAAPAAA